MLPATFDAASVDALILPADTLTKAPIRQLLSNKPWIMVSPRKSDAFQAWQLGAVYFLLRPYSIPDLMRALERAEQMHYWNRGQVPPQIHNRTIDLQLTKGRRLSVPLRNILFLEAQGEITQVFLDLPGQEKIAAIRNLGHWEQALGDVHFVRIHKKYLVNMSHVSALVGSALKVLDFQLPVAKRRQKEVELEFSKWQKQRTEPVNGMLSS